MDDPILGVLIELAADVADLDFQTAKDMAKGRARGVAPNAMLLSWHNGKTGEFGPPVRCGADLRPPWVVWAASRGANLTVSVNRGAYVFYFLLLSSGTNPAYEDVPGDEFDRMAQDIDARLPPGPRVGIVGGTVFYRPHSAELCREVGRQLADFDPLVVITGGVAGVGETVGLAYQAACIEAGRPPLLYHVLPEGFPPAGSGKTLKAGTSMPARRQVLACLAPVYVAVEGGDGTADEIRIACRQPAVVVAVAATGGAAKSAWPELPRPVGVLPEDWQRLSDERLAPADLAGAVVRIVATVLGL